MNPVPVEDYMRNLRAAIGAHRITRAALDALITAGPTICTAHGLPVAFGALVNGRPACAACVKGLRVPPLVDSLFDLIPPRAHSAYHRLRALAHARLTPYPASREMYRAIAAVWEGNRHAR